MWNILIALGFMALGGLAVHVSWLHAWRMYKRGKEEGQSQNVKPTRIVPPPVKGVHV